MAHLEKTGRRRSQESESHDSVSSKSPFAWSSLERLIPVILVIGFLLLWELLARFEQISTLFFPAPSATAETLWLGLVTGQLVNETKATVVRMLAGFLIGGGLGLLTGLVLGWSARLRAIFDPLFAALHPFPKIALLPLVLVIFGLGETSRIFIVAVAAFFPMLISSMAGVQQINPIYFEVAANYGASRRKLFWRVVFPGSLPSILAGARLSLNLALVITVAVELRFAGEGLGSILWRSWETLRTTYLYATLVIIAVIGIGSNWLLAKIQRRLVPWHK